MGKGQELLDAAREGDRKTVEKILGQITKRSGPFTSLRRGAGVNVQDDNGYTPLHHACLRGHREVVRLLLSVDASPCIVDKKSATPLHLAAWKGDSEVVAMLLAHNTPPVNIDHPTTDHETALIIASQFRNVDVVAQLLARGADVTVRNIKNETALDLAAQYGRLDTVKLLLRARPQLVDEYRFPVCRGRVFPSTPLHRASKNGHKDVVSTLIAAGMDPNVRTNNGTALHEASNYGKASVVRILLAKGADLNAFDRRGKTVHDILNEYSEEATERVRRIIREHMATNGYESEEDLPPFPVQDYSPTGYSNTVGMKAPETQEIITNSLSSPSSILTKHPSNFVKRLANKLGFKGKFNSAPNISNTDNDAAVKSKYVKRSSTNTVSIGNSKFFHMLSKKEESGEVVCNDEFDTISLDRVGTIERNSTVNRSNRSCPGFKTSLPNIAENVELSDSNDSLADSVVITEIDQEIDDDFEKNHKKPIEAINNNSKLSIFEPRDNMNSNPRSSTGSTNVINECYESYEIPKVPVKTKTVNVIDDVDLIPKPPPRPIVNERKISNDGVIYENINIKPSIIPIPAARVNLPHKLEENRINYENVTPLPRRKPEPPKRTVIPRKASPESVTIDSSPSVSRTSTMSSDSMVDEANFEDILLSKKSASFKHRTTTNYNLKAQSSQSIASDFSEASALENVDVSAEVDEKSMYLSMTGTLPNKKPERAVKKKVLFRHKTFTNIEVDPRNNYSKNNNELKKETLANYHIKGTGHCIYKAPTVQEFIEVFNRDTLYSDVAPFQKVPRTRDSYIETTICFCKPKPKKFYKSAEDLLAITQDEEKVTIDVDALRNSHELNSTSFQCFCDEVNCTFHAKNREALVNLVVKFSAIKKSISTPDITLDSSPVSTTNKPLVKNKSVPYKLEEPYAVLDLKDIISRQWSNNSDIKDCSLTYSTMSNPSSMSTCSRPYSVKDISDVISIKDTNSLSSDACDVKQYMQQKSASEHSGHWSLHTCNSNVTVKSDVSFKSCLEEPSSSDDGTLNSEEDSETDTVKSEVDCGWVHSDSFRVKKDVILEEQEPVESGIEMSPVDYKSCENVPGLVGVALLERGSVRSGSGRRRWEEEGTSEGDALSVSSAASSCAPHLAHHHDYNKVSPTPPKKPPRRNLSVSPTHANSPSSGYSYELRAHARSQDDLDDLQSTKHYLKHGRSIDQYVDGKLSYSEYEEYDNSPRIAPIPNPRTKPRTQPVAITAMYENVVIKEQNPRRKLKRNSFGPQNENFEMNSKKYSTQERSSMESLLDDTHSMNSPSDCERYYEGSRVEVPLSPSHYEPPPTPDHPPPSARQAENSIHERIRPLSQRIMEVIEEIRIRKKSQGDMFENT